MLFKNDNNLIHKRNKKKLSKKHLFKHVNFDLVKYNDDTQLLDTLYKSLLACKKKHVSEYGIILDTNVIVHDITYIPLPPKTYDILCLESELESYKNVHEKSIYWTPTNIINTGNFIINGSSIDKILNIIKSSKNINHFYKNLNNINIFTITQTHLSEKEKNYIHDPLIINKKLTEQDIINYDSKLSKEFYNKFQNLNLTPDKLHYKYIQNTLLPKISLICPFTNKNKLFHTLLTFLKLDYPQNLLELIIIDDTNSEKDLNLPEDKRIKLININNTNDTDNLPLGYKINVGVKHSTHNIIMHFFDTNIYTLNFKKLISHFILSNKSCMTSIDTGIYNNNLNDIIKLPDLANCIYTKDFWKKLSFEEISHNFITNSDLTYKWLSYRHKEISFLPFIYISFKIIDESQSKLLFDEKYNCSLNLSNLVDKKIKESFELIV